MPPRTREFRALFDVIAGAADLGRPSRLVVICLRTGMKKNWAQTPGKGTMATDYDAPRKTDEELHEDSIEELKTRRNDKNSGKVDEDEAEAAEAFELPGADRTGAAPAIGRIHLRWLLPGAAPQSDR